LTRKADKLSKPENVFIADDYSGGDGEVFTELPGLEQAGRFRVINPADSTVVMRQSELSGMLQERYNLGFQKAILEKERFREETVRNLVSFSRTAEQSLRDILTGAGKEVLRLSMEIAEQIIRKEIEFDPEEVLESQIMACLDYMEDRLPVLLRINPADREAAESILAESSQKLPERLKLVEDDSIGRGGCIMKLDRGSLRAVISEQLRRIGEALESEYDRSNKR
jgi:flagellar biosynthesis/type III secretory pathway protein FliH